MDAKFLDELLANTQIATEALKTSMNALSNVMDETLKNVPESDKPKVAEIKNKINNAFAAAREGDTNAVNDILKSFE